MSDTPENLPEIIRDHIHAPIDRLRQGRIAVCFMLGGQPGAGKSSGLAKALGGKLTRAQQDGGLIVIDADSYRMLHPDYEIIAKVDPLEAVRMTQPFVQVLVKEALTYAMGKKINILYDGTMRDPESAKILMASFRENGYRVECCFVATCFNESAISIYFRYESEIHKGRIGRLVASQFHEEAFEGVAKTLRVLENKCLCDAIVIYTRLGVIIYNNELSAKGRWQRPRRGSFLFKRARMESVESRARSIKMCKEVCEYMSKRSITQKEALEIIRLSAVLFEAVTDFRVKEVGLIASEVPIVVGVGGARVIFEGEVPVMTPEEILMEQWWDLNTALEMLKGKHPELQWEQK